MRPLAKSVATHRSIPLPTQKQRVTEMLRERILDEQIPPGSWIRLRDVASELGTSTMPIREALQILASEGLVAFYPHRGAQVSPLSLEGFEELYMARLGLEGLAARLGAELMSDADIGEMREVVRQMEQATDAGDLDGFLDLDLRFHAIHYRAAQRPRLAGRIESLKRLGRPYHKRARLSFARTGFTREFHRRVLKACEAHDGSLAERLVREDLDFTVRFFRDDGLFEARSAHGSAPRNRKADKA